jgi:hypothetical protein
MVKVAALGTITVMVFSRIVMRLDGPVEEVPGFLDLLAYAGQVHKPERGVILIYQVLKRYAVKGQIVITEVKTFLRKVITLLDKVEIGVLHFINLQNIDKNGEK